MFCAECGQPIDEGKAFCKGCGAAVLEIPGSLAGQSPTLVVTEVKPPTAAATDLPADSPTGAATKPEVWGTPVGSPPVAPLAVAPPPPPPPASRFSPPPPPPAPGIAPPPPPALTPRGYGAPWQPPPPPPGPRSRTGLLVGIIAAVVVVLAGAGVGAYLLLRGDDTTKTTTTLVGSSSTTGAKTTTTAAMTTTTSVQTTTTAAGSTTTQTIRQSTTTTRASTTSTTAGQSLNDYLTATDAMVLLLENDDARIPVLATQINNTAPHVPQAVYDELQSMMGQLDATYTSLGEVFVPAGFEESNGWLLEAGTAMGTRIYATIQGIEAMWDANTVSAGTTHFNEGRTARDQYRAALQKYHDTVPID